MDVQVLSRGLKPTARNIELLTQFLRIFETVFRGLKPTARNIELLTQF